MSVSEPYVSIEVVWSDPDLLEIEASVSFEGWSARERAYVGRDELHAFADQLDDLVDGSADANLQAGELDLSYIQLLLYEFGLARRLEMDIRMGSAKAGNYGGRESPRRFQTTVPVERGQLARFASAIRNVTRKERGEALLRLPVH